MVLQKSITCCSLRDESFLKVTNAHGTFDLIEAVINSNTTITDKVAAARTAIDAEETELGF